MLKTFLICIPCLFLSGCVEVEDPAVPQTKMCVCYAAPTLQVNGVDQLDWDAIAPQTGPDVVLAMGWAGAPVCGPSASGFYWIGSDGTQVHDNCLAMENLAAGSFGVKWVSPDGCDGAPPIVRTIQIPVQ